MTSLIIVGAGGFGLEVAAYAQDCVSAGRAAFTPKGFLDDTKTVGALHHGLPVLGDTATAIDAEALYLIAVGDSLHRRTLCKKLTAQGAHFATLIHPSAYAASTSVIAEGCVLAPFAFAGPASRIGAQGVLNIYASVAHESTLGAFCTLSPYAGTHGGSVLGEAVFLGAQATITKDVRIGPEAKIAAGAVAYNDIPEYVTAMGNPARFRAA